MSSSQPGTMPSPAPILETLNAYQRSACLKGAIDLDLFTAIAEGNRTVEAIAKRIGGTERGTRILCDYLTVTEILEKSDSNYSLTPMAAMFLDRRLPSYLGTTAMFLSQIHSRHFFDDVAELVRRGRNLEGDGGTVSPDNPIWIDFARSMAPMMAMPAQFIAGTLGAPHGDKWKVLDLAAGHGLFGIAIAQHNPNAEIWALDSPLVLDVAQENAAARGVAGRFHRMPGDAFSVDFGTGYDVVLLTNFLHHFDPPTCETLLTRVHAALKPGGRAATLEFVPNPDRISPPIPAEFSMVMLATTPSGDAYTFAELERMFSNTGFTRSEPHVVPPGAQTLIVSHA